jgi:cation:H+ antiporter
VGLFAPLTYMTYVYFKGSLSVWDAAWLVLIYVAYLFVLSKMPPQEHEGIEDLDLIPRTVVTSGPGVRNASIAALFIVGGAIIYFAAEPFLGSLLAVSTLVGVPSFVFVQWVAPFVSEFPEKVSAFHWARTVDRAPMALMNMVSSNINQWTLLTAMLPLVYSMSVGSPAAIEFDNTQKLELLMTLGQSFIGMMFLVNMKLSWWEAAALFGLWAIQFAFSPIPPGPGMIGYISANIHEWVTWAYLAWSAAEVVRTMAGKRKAVAFALFARIWRARVMAR